jgi:hypothetical protein
MTANFVKIFTAYFAFGRRHAGDIEPVVCLRRFRLWKIFYEPSAWSGASMVFACEAA